MAIKQILVPDIGNFKDVNVIEVIVKAGDNVNTEDPLITLETDKAAMDVPSPYSGVIKEMRVKAGDKVSQGSVILLLESGDQIPPSPPFLKGGMNVPPGPPLPKWGSDKRTPPLAKGVARSAGGFEVVLLVDTFNRYFEPENARAALAVLQAAGYTLH